jgi:hypothetical protein
MTTVSDLLLSDDSAFAKALPSAASAKAVFERVRAKWNIDVRDLLMEAWRTRSALKTAAQETLDTPGLVKKVTLKSFTIPWEHGMDLEARLNGKHIASVTVGVQVQLEVTALIAMVQSGRLMAIEGGMYKASASGTVANHALLGRSATLDLRYEMPLGDGIPLIRQTKAD